MGLIVKKRRYPMTAEYRLYLFVLTGLYAHNVCGSRATIGLLYVKGNPVSF